jgi:hypothetical protein
VPGEHEAPVRYDDAALCPRRELIGRHGDREPEHLLGGRGQLGVRAGGPAHQRRTHPLCRHPVHHPGQQHARCVHLPVLHDHGERVRPRHRLFLFELAGIAQRRRGDHPLS